MPERAVASRARERARTGHEPPSKRSSAPSKGRERELARKLRAQIARLETRSLRPRVPAGLQAAPTTASDKTPGPRKVAAVKVTPKTDARKRQLGDEGERWALASVLSPIVALDAAEEARCD